MQQSAKELERRKKSLSRIKNLILSINTEDIIIKYNNECERVFGYKRKEVLNKRFLDTLIPHRYFEQWANRIRLVKRDSLTEEFNLPLLTKHGHEIMISWDSFPLKDTEGVVKDIGFVGKLIDKWEDVEEPIVEKLIIDVQKIDDDTENEKKIKKLQKDHQKLQKKCFQLEYKNLELQKELKNAINQEDNEEGLEKIRHSPVGKSLYSVSNIVGGKKRKDELERTMRELEDKRTLLDEREAQLINEKRSINERRKEFVTWREKLELLEDEIKKREDGLSNKEKELKQAIFSGSDRPLQPNSIVTTEDIVDYPDFINNISESAIIIQRGIFKQVNEPFMKLIGYTSEELIDKSVFDFVAPEGFQGVGSYYLNRIKGENVSKYETVLLTKDDYKLVVELSNRPTMFNGQKAEIAIVREIKKEKINEKN